MPVLIDSRTGSVELTPYMSQGVECVSTRLEYGDAAFLGVGPNDEPVGIGIERKTISDLCSCISDGRLSGHQLIGLTNEYFRVFVLVEGVWRCGESGIVETYRSGRWNPLTLGNRQYMSREICNYLVTLNIMCGVIPWQTPDIRHSARWLSDLYRWWQKPWGHHKAHKQFHTVEQRATVRLTKPGIVHRVAKELTGVGWGRGEYVAKRFQSVRELANARVEDLLEVDGIGPLLAGRIFKELSGEKV